jgi:predicted acyltransferase
VITGGVADPGAPREERPGGEQVEGHASVTVRRDPSIDVLRGGLVVVLVLVEWLLSGSYAWLRHSPWNGVRIADFVFPGYLFVVGASMAVGRERSWARSVRRLVLLVALGLAFNACTTTSPLRFTGVLQMIGVSGFLAGVALRVARRTDDVALAAGALLLVHGAVVAHAFDVDRWVFDDRRLYHEGLLGHDPEGVLACTLGATSLVLLGAVALRLRSWWFVLGLAALAGVAWLAWEPNKRAWTPPFTLLMAATFALLLAALGPIAHHVPLLGRIGRNALLVYIGQHAVRELWEPTAASHLQLAAAATVVSCAAAWTLDRLGVRLRV